MSDKRKFPRADAIAVAKEIVEALRPCAERIIVAGSLRRRRPEVGDVEILYVPRVECIADPDSLLDEKIEFNRADAAVARLERTDILSRRLSSAGHESFGEKNKLMLHRATGIPVDLFSATEENWWNYLVCRTGGAENNVAICTAAIRKGWKWEPYSAGFYRIGHTEKMTSERHVFEFVGLPYLEPEDRR